jgi:hypothetical protein
LVPACFVFILLLAACVPGQEQGGTVPPGGDSAGDLSTQLPNVDVSPFCEDVTTDSELAEQLIAQQDQIARLRAMIAVGPISALSELVVPRLAGNQFDLVVDLIPLSAERQLFGREGSENKRIGSLPALARGDKPIADTFADQGLALIRVSDGAPLSSEARRYLRSRLYSPEMRSAGVVAAPNMRLTIGASTNHSGGGGPFGAAPHPYTAASPVDAYADFRGQYAFTDMGFPAPISDRGTNTTIFVLDSWPVNPTWLDGLPPRSYLTLRPSLTMTNTDFDITVIAPPLTHTVGSTSTVLPGNVHGRFVASLAHTVAPEAEIQVYRVLNDAGETYLSDLLDALAFVEAELQAAPALTGVINMSLGLTCLEIAHDHLDPEADAGIAEDEEALNALNNKILDILAAQQVVVSAASGNHSFPNLDRHIYSLALCPLTSEGLATDVDYPACLENVISVGASTKAPTVSCYSNGDLNPDLFAYAGDGLLVPLTGSSAICKPDYTTCTDNQCAKGVLGLKDIPGQFGFWSGTSFATPLVSGAAAVLLGAGVAVNDVPSCLIMNADTTGGLRRLNLPAALSACGHPKGS